MKIKPAAYMMLFLSVMAQTYFTFGWFPDLVVLVVVITASMASVQGGFIFGIAAGLLRGIITPYMLPADILIFPVIALLSAIAIRLFYSHTPLTCMLISLVSMVTLISSHILFLNSISGNSLDPLSVIFGNMGTVFTTTIISPVVFSYLGGILEVKEY